MKLYHALPDPKERQRKKPNSYGDYFLGNPQNPNNPYQPNQKTMDYQRLEKEFDLILEKPLWMRPIALSELAKKNKIPLSSIRVSFDNFWSQRLREDQQNKR